MQKELIRTTYRMQCMVGGIIAIFVGYVKDVVVSQEVCGTTDTTKIGRLYVLIAAIRCVLHRNVPHVRFVESQNAKNTNVWV